MGGERKMLNKDTLSVVSGIALSYLYIAWFFVFIGKGKLLIAVLPLILFELIRQLYVHIQGGKNRETKSDTPKYDI